MDLKEDKKCAKIITPEDILTEIDREIYASPKRKLAREVAQERGFNDEYEMAGWLYFNRLDNSQFEGYDVDVLHMTSSGEGFEY